MVITGVADRMPSRIKALVYLDAFVPEHGQSLTDLLRIALPAEVAAGFLGAFHGTALENHSGLMAPIPAEAFGIKAENRAWVDRRCVGQPLATFEMPLLLKGAGAAVHPGGRLGPEPVPPLCRQVRRPARLARHQVGQQP